MRGIVTEWMYEVCEDRQICVEVFLLSVQYLDTFLSCVTISKSQFQLVSASCLLLASKFQAVVPLSAIQLVQYTDHSITIQELQEWELHILSTLQWQLSLPTSNSFLDQILARAPSVSNLSASILSQLHSHALSLLTYAATQYSFLLVPQSLLAGAALSASFLSLGLSSSIQCEVMALLQCPTNHLDMVVSALQTTVSPKVDVTKTCSSTSLPTFHSLNQSRSFHTVTTPTNTLAVLSAEGA